MPATAIVHTTDLAAADDLSEGDLVRWGPSNATRYGEVYEIETDGEITSKTNGEGETTMEGTEDNPAFLIRHYEAGEDEWAETDTYTVHRADPLEKIDSFPNSVDNSARIILSASASTPTREVKSSGTEDDAGGTSIDTSAIVRPSSGDGEATSPPSVSIPDRNDLEVTDLRSAAENMNPVDMAVGKGRVTQLDASEDDVAEINNRHGLDLSPSEVMMFRDFAASTGPMRGKRLRFTRRALDRFVNLFQKGRPYVLHHDPDRFVGSTLRATVVEDTEIRGFQGDWLAVDWFAVLRDAGEQRKQDLMDVRTGLQYTSIRFTGGDWEMMSEEVGDEEVRFMLVDDNPPESGQTSFDRLDAMHVSRVELGAVKGAGATPDQ